jgi:hypothetical protein
MSATTTSTVTASGTQATPLPVVGSGSTAAAAPVIQLPGSGAGAAAGAAYPTTGLAGVRNDGAVTVPLDAFAKRSGPDVKIKTEQGNVSLHAVYQQDPVTKEMTVSLVDESGRLIRMIPPDSVAKMISAMTAYRGR